MLRYIQKWIDLKGSDLKCDPFLLPEIQARMVYTKLGENLNNIASPLKFNPM